MSTIATAKDVIEVFADISCPFTQAGLHRWFARRDELGRHDVFLRVRAWPLEIINGAPLTADFIAPKVAALAKPFPSLFAGFPPRVFPATTLPALHLTHAAYRVDLATGESTARRLRDLLFVDGVDIADPDVLAALATELGVPTPDESDRDSVLADLKEGRELGVIGSPHYFGAQVDVFCPGLEIGHTNDTLDVTAAAEKFDDFMTRCFA